MIETTETVLLAQRQSDGLFLALEKAPHSTFNSYVKEPEKAERVFPNNAEHINNPEEAPYYFENSDRFKRWLEDCIMVPYTIETRVVATRKVIT